MNELQQKIEALLFYRNEPTTYSWLAKQLGIKAGEVYELVASMMIEYKGRGLTLVYSEDSVSLLSADIAKDEIALLTKTNEERELSKQALETLSIILYKGKVTKSEVDYIRGVNSVFILRNLLLRGLIEKKANPLDKRSPLYKVSHQALSYMGINSKSDLPDLEKVEKKLAELNTAWQDELHGEKLPVNSDTDE